MLSLQVLDNSRRLHLGDAADATRNAFSHFTNTISTAVTSHFQNLQSAFSGPAAAAAPQTDPGHEGGLPARQDAAAVQVRAVRAEAPPQAAAERAEPARVAAAAEAAEVGAVAVRAQPTPATEAAPAGTTLRVAVRAPDSAEASPMEERVAGRLLLQAFADHLTKKMNACLVAVDN